jgi:hypothetical protein
MQEAERYRARSAEAVHLCLPPEKLLLLAAHQIHEMIGGGRAPHGTTGSGLACSYSAGRVPTFLSSGVKLNSIALSLLDPAPRLLRSAPSPRARPGSARPRPARRPA